MSVLKDTKRFFLDGIPVLVAFALLFTLAMLGWWALGNYLDLPVVYESHSTGECVEVEAPAQTAECYDCNNLPPRYHHVWVM